MAICSSLASFNLRFSYAQQSLARAAFASAALLCSASGCSSIAPEMTQENKQALAQPQTMQTRPEHALTAMGISKRISLDCEPGILQSRISAKVDGPLLDSKTFGNDIVQL